ncbi:hypothetical protein OG211_12240 [Streptomyces niveus]|uniref:hypothetical protein n=1 Tax=Streptomyces niveus TaxID=193462 RepID=UPI00386BD94E|nr:hypothetical protein OG211_12240 [Streptomyces niveus]
MTATPVGPGYDDPEYDDYDPAWVHQDTPFRRWLVGRLTDAGSSNAVDNASLYAPANRYNGLSSADMDLLATLTGATIDDVRAAHKADLADWGREQQLRDHPDLAVLDADLDRITRQA